METGLVGQMFFSHGTNHSRGVLILIAPQVNLKIEGITSHVDGRYVFLKGAAHGLKLFIVGRCILSNKEQG